MSAQSPANSKDRDQDDRDDGGTAKKSTSKATGPKPKPPNRASSKLPVVVEPSSINLTKSERALVAEALRRAESARNVIEGTLLDFGR